MKSLELVSWIFASVLLGGSRASIIYAGVNSGEFKYRENAL